jgi:WD40 repeat protein
LLATGESNGNTYLYPVGGSQPFATLRTGSEVYAVAFSPNGALVATGDRNGRTYLWKAATGSWITTIHVPGEKDVNSLAFSPQGGMLAIGSANGTTYLWDISRSGHTVTPSGTLANPATGEGIWSLAFNPEGTVLATGDYAGDTYLWHLTAPSSQPALLPGPAGQPITAVAFSADGDTLATGTGDVFGTGSRISSAYLWDVSTGHRVSVIGEPATVWGVAFDAAGTLAIGDADGSTYLVNGATGQPIEPLADPSSGTQGVGAVAFSDNGRVLAAGDTNGATYLWKVS